MCEILAIRLWPLRDTSLVRPAQPKCTTTQATGQRHCPTSVDDSRRSCKAGSAEPLLDPSEGVPERRQGNIGADDEDQADEDKPTDRGRGRATTADGSRRSAALIDARRQAASTLQSA